MMGWPASFIRSLLMGMGQDWVKHLRKREHWAVISPYGNRRPAVYYIQSVIETARQQVQEAINQQKRGGREQYSTRAASSESPA